MKNPYSIDVLIVGAGQGGLGVSKFLSDSSLEVSVLEQGRIGETWRTQRWDSFTLNTPNWMNGLPGAPYGGPDPMGFMTHGELLASFESYVEQYELPIRTGVTVTRIGRAGEGRRFEVDAVASDGEHLEYKSDSVVLATGIARLPNLPEVASKLPGSINQLHTGTYRSPVVLPDGAVVVVGGGQSGAQIVEDLVRADRTVYFAISDVARFPRRYRGRDFMEWFADMGIWDVTTEGVPDPTMISATNPLVSGVGPLGHTISYQQLAQQGVHLMGRLLDVDQGVLISDDRALEYVRNSDSASSEIRSNIDKFIEESGVEAPDPEPDPADEPLSGELRTLNRLDLAAAKVGSVIWCTGFRGDFSWVDLPITDGDEVPVHSNGASEVAGVYFIGFPWLSTRKSGIVFGIEADARRISSQIVEELTMPGSDRREARSGGLEPPTS